MNVRTLWMTLIGIASTFGAAVSLHGQATVLTVPVDSILTRFERETRAHDHVGRGMELIVITFARGPQSARKDSLLDGLERLVDVSTDREVRGTAAQMVASAGEAEDEIPPLPGIVRRLERIYRRHGNNDDSLVRLSILSSLPLQGERVAAAALLRSIAAQPDPGNNGTGPEGYFSVGDPRTEALAGLSKMGAEGRAVLQAMYRGGEAASPQARITLEHMAQRGFPVTDSVERRRAANRQTIQP